jgi:hypothetical protein
MATEVASKLPDGVDEAISEFLSFVAAALRRLRGLPNHPVNAEAFNGYLSRAQQICREIVGDI